MINFYPDWLQRDDDRFLLGFSVRCIGWCWLTVTMWWGGLSLYLTFCKPWFSLLQVLMHCTPDSAPPIHPSLCVSCPRLSVRLPFCPQILKNFLPLLKTCAPSLPLFTYVPTELFFLQLFILLKIKKVPLLFLSVWSLLILSAFCLELLQRLSSRKLSLASLGNLLLHKTNQTSHQEPQAPLKLPKFPLKLSFEATDKLFPVPNKP